MSYAHVAVESSAYARAHFIQKTYTHLAFAILGFIGVETLLLKSPLAPAMMQFLQTTPYSWLIVLGAFIAVSWIAEKWATSGASIEKQYMGLALFVIAEAIIFLPLLFIAAHYASTEVIPTAGVITLCLFATLTFIAFTSKKDFSFLGGILTLASFVAMGAIVCSILFGFPLNTVIFSSFMVVLAGGAILYDTSKILHHYRTDQHVAAALALFASVALMFYYVLMLVMSRE